ncbi:bifunctional metallophosphatase/5'-nucleotidase [Brevibacillus dissolubilis]|uniref:bifunctional metallophosphatase/5'-nucleotidase n=1 Tax=Brevibacillus dissolubilis TaxID=1844116 RepID=UPI00210016BC|nr:5'-nucleotidase C-terminal domain-containing protein [Brevibacillus dissolubilis]
MIKWGKASVSILSAALVSSLFAGMAAAAPIHPVQHADWMKEEALVSGYDNGELGLERMITFAEAVTLLTRVKGEKLTPAANGHWAAPSLNWAEKQGALTAAEAQSPNANPTAIRIQTIANKLGISLKLSGQAQVKRGEFLQALGDAITEHVTIAHMNDVHGHIEENPSGKEFGYAKLATIIKEWRQENENLLLLDAGDTFQGTVFVNQFKGESVVPILNKLGFNAMAAGNHEFDFGVEQLNKLASQLQYPILNANVIKQDGSELLRPYINITVNGKKYAIISVVAEDTPILTHPDNVKGVTFKAPIETVKATVAKAKTEADHIILLSHVGAEVDREIAKSVEGIDLIVGGHSHTQIEKPELVNGTYILQDWEYGKSLGRADLYYYKNELVTMSGGLFPYDEKIKADPEIDKMVKDVVKRVDDVMKDVIVKSEVDLDGDRNFVRKRETNVGNLITDIMVEKTKTIKGHEADIAITNGGGIRTQLKAGDLTKKDLYSLLPFPNTLVVLEATGAEIKEALESGVSDVENGAGRFPQVSGLSFSYDPKKPAGERLIELKVAGQPIDPAKTYKVATNDFIAAGGDGYTTLKKPAFNTGITLYSMMEEALLARKTINPKVEGRIVEVK